MFQFLPTHANLNYVILFHQRSLSRESTLVKLFAIRQASRRIEWGIKHKNVTPLQFYTCVFLFDPPPPATDILAINMGRLQGDGRMRILAVNSRFGPHLCDDICDQNNFKNGPGISDPLLGFYHKYV